MHSELNSTDGLVERLEKLEKHMRWIKRISLIAVAVLAVLVLGYRLARYRQATAQEFILTDASGQPRARLANFPEGPGLEMYAAGGERRVQLIGGGEEAMLNLYIPVTAGQGAASINLLKDTTLMSSFRAGPSAVILEMHSSRGNGNATLALQHGTTSLTLSGAAAASPQVSLQSDRTHACVVLGGTDQTYVQTDPPSAGGSLCLSSPGLPTLELADLRGNRAVLGIPQTTPARNPKPQADSAASLNLEAKSGKTLRLAPQ